MNPEETETNISSLQPERSLRDISEVGLLQIQETKPDTSENANEIDEAGKVLFRSVLRPLVYDQAHRGVDVSAQRTMQSVILETINNSGIQLSPELIDQIRERYLSDHQDARSWYEKMMELTRQGMDHPLNQLSQIVYDQLPQDVKMQYSRTTFNL